jgi:Ca2+-transporting ATPase
MMATETLARPKEVTRQQESWHAMDTAAVLATLEVRDEIGLAADEAEKRRATYGSNELKAKPPKPAIIRFLLQFHNPLLYILLVAGTIKALLGQWTNAIVIWGVTVINAIISYIQEAKAEQAITALAKSITTKVTVIRNGKRQVIPSEELVPGDIVLLSSGDRVPADLRLLSAQELRTDESALTGESVAVDKRVAPAEADSPLAERHSMVYAGTFVTSGQARGVVIATGAATETGRISELMEQHANLSTPLTRKFEAFSRVLMVVILIVAALTFVVGWLNGRDLIEMFEAAIALAVAAIPEGLPAVVTVTLAIGVNRMARRNAIIRKLPAVETLGSATVICSDKTGTLTQNQMTVQNIYAGGKLYEVSGAGNTADGDVIYQEAAVRAADSAALHETLRAGVLCNSAHLEPQDGHRFSIIGDPTEGALLVAGQKAGLEQDALLKAFPQEQVIPFASQYQYMASLHKAPEGFVIYLKGSAEALLERCVDQLNEDGSLEPFDEAAVQANIRELASRGMRVLVFARKRVDEEQLSRDIVTGGLTFLGLQGMIDPPRPEAIKAVATCHEAGIQVKMITGDHIATATAIAKEMGFQTDAQSGELVGYTGRELAAMDDVSLQEAMERGAVFARVAPEQKLRLVQALQARNEIVAMTGDGVNDAPALRRADIGVAMGKSGTEVAKEAADMILTDDNFASIEAAVEEGRTVYKNLLRSVAFILPVNGGESMTIFISALLGRVLPILSLQVLWLNMINSITMTVPLAFEPKTERVMKEKPRSPDERLLHTKLLWRILLVSVFNWILIFGMFEWANDTYGSEPLARTMAIQALVAGRIIYLISVSHLSQALINKLRGRPATFGEVPALFMGIVGAMVLQVAFSQLPFMNTFFGTAPMNLEQWGICILVGLPIVFIAALANRVDPID